MSIFKKLFGNSQNDMKEVITMTNTQKALELINTFLPCVCSGKNHGKQYPRF